jgi:hypothetical protein
MPATGARVEMTTQCGGTTAPNGPQHLDVLPAEPVAISFQESSARTADEIGHLQGAAGSATPPVGTSVAAAARPEDSLSPGDGVQKDVGK